MRTPPPLRFLGVVVGGWACLRVAMLAPDWVDDAAAERLPLQRQSAQTFPAAVPAPDRPVMTTAAEVRPAFLRAPLPPPPSVSLAPEVIRAGLIFDPEVLAFLSSAPAASPSQVPLEASRAVFSDQIAVLPTPSGPQQALAAASRWSASAWAFVREGRGSQLAPGGLLGGSQIGARIAYRLNNDASRPLALSGRLYSPKETRGSEAAVGVEWKPVAELPVRLLAERRQALGSEGRSAFSLLAHGGVYDLPVGPLRFNAYGQAGIVGAKSRDLFGEGSTTLRLPLDSREAVRVGAGAWAAAQPGVHRVDAGPSISVALPVEGRNLTLSADWRVRVTGDARPGSGSALNIGKDF